MRYLSVCSGIEAATVAWHHFGWTPAAFSEIEPFPSAVLKHHYPDVPNVGDMTRFKEWDIGSIDLLVGGTPCQSFSVAGLRKGLHDPRGGLMLTFLEIAQRYRPRWVVWENVPGVLSSNGGRDFGAFLGALGELGYGWAYRVLDAQWFGVAQRRRRVFVVGCLGDQASAAAVLFESESVCRDTPPRREARQGFARGVEGSVTSGGIHDTVNAVAQPIGLDEEQNAVIDGFGTLKARTESGGFQGCVAHPVVYERHDQDARVKEVSVAPTLHSKSDNTCDLPMVMQPVAFAQNTRDEVRLMNGDGSIVGALAAEPGMKQTCYVAQPVAFRDPCPTLTAKMQGSSGWAPANEDAHLVGVAQPVAFHPTQDPISSEDGTTHAMGCGSKQGTATVAVAQPIAFKVRGGVEVDSGGKAAGKGYLGSEETAFTLAATQDQWLAAPAPVGTDCYNGAITGDVAATIGTPGSSVNASGPTVMQPVDVKQVQWASGGGQIENDTAQALRAGAEYNYQFARVAMQVRRLTPTECERLQGFPDDYTNIPWRKKGEAPDGPRYKALGNSMAVPCMRWIGERITAATRQEVKP